VIARFISFLFLIGTFTCSGFALDSKTEQRDREELRKALQRYLTEYPGFQLDLRPGAPALTQQLRRIDAWRKQNPCPSTRHKSGACPGYVISGPSDAPQWRTAK
jgi:hypothetical protein